MLKLIKLALGPMQTNCYIVYDELTKEAALFDAACSCSVILSKLDEVGCKLKYIIITHAHADHIGALDELKVKTHAKLCIGKRDRKSLNDNTLSLCSMFGTQAPTSTCDIEINDGDVLCLGKSKLKFIETPGHTPGGISAYFDDKLISGDTLFYESVGRSDFPGGSMSELVRSIRDKLFLLPDETAVFPGHGEATTIGHEKRCNPWVM